MRDERSSRSDSTHIADPGRLWRWLADPRAPRRVALLVLLLCLPSLSTGLAMDDYLLARAVDHGYPAWDLFRFVGPATRPGSLEEGMFGWWAAPDLQVEFLRPLSSLWHAVDFRSWGRHPWLMHLESALAYAGLVLVAARVYRRILGPGVAMGLATLLFAIDDTHAQAVGWIANRNLVLAMTLGFAALWAHDRWCTERWRAGSALGPVLLAAALSSAEAGVATLGYLVAHACFVDIDRWWRRLASLTPYFVVVAVWRLVYASLDVHVVGSGLYRDPTADPWGLGVAAVHNIGILVAAQLTVPVANPLAASPRGWLWALAGLAAVTWWLAPLLRRSATARFHALGMVLAAVPFAATLASDRVLLPLGLGGAGLCAEVVVTARASGRIRRGARGLAKGVMVVHLWLSALLFVPSLLAVRLFEIPTRALTDAIVREASGPLVAVVNVPFDVLLMYPPAMAARQDRPWPRHVYPLYAGRGTVSLRRVSDDAVEMWSDPGWMASPLNRFARSVDRPMHAGQHIALGAMTVEIVEVNGAGRPRRVRIVFDRALDEIRWIAWIDGAPTAWTMPRGSESVALPTDLTL